jgi:RNA polymerase sigma factor (TIGR02999 family)
MPSGEGDSGEHGDVTALLRAWRGGDEGARERLIEEVYATLKRIAGAQLRRERRGVTLDATGLVHEAYLRLAGAADVDWRDRGHFFAIAAIAMRRVLVDRARSRLAAKRDPGDFLVTHAGADTPVSPEEILDLDQALERLQREEPRLARVVEMRYFAGLEHGEIAEVLGVSGRTVKRDWAFARAWLLRELAGR